MQQASPPLPFVRSFNNLTIYIVFLAALFAPILFLLNKHIDPFYMVFLVVILTICSSAIVKFVPSHPIVWLTPFLFLYHFSVVLLDIIGIRHLSESNQVIWVAWLSTVSFVIGGLLTTIKPSSPTDVAAINNQNRAIYSAKKIHPLALNLTYFLGLISCIPYCYYYLALGLTKAASNDIPYLFVFNFLTYLPTISIVMAIYQQNGEIRRKKIYYQCFLAFFTLLLTTLITGEREIIFLFLVSAMLAFYTNGFITKTQIAWAASILLFLVPVLGALKNIFLKQSIQFSLLELPLDLLTGEFISAGRNIETILISKSQWEYFLGKTYINEIIRAFLPTVIYSGETSVNWFAQTFHQIQSQKGLGYGFSLAAQGFINFGYAGVIFNYFFLGLILSAWHYSIRKNKFSGIMFVLYAPFVIYAQRADFANLLSPLLKRILFPLLLIMILSHLITIFEKNVSRAKKL